MKKIIFIISLLLLTGCTPQLPYWNKINCGVPADPPPPAKPFSFYNYSANAYECIRGVGSAEICGYDCKIAGGRAKCANYPTQHCIVGSSDYITCGYACMRSRRGDVACGTRFEDTCVVTEANTVMCGANCRVERGKAKCDPTPPFREEFPSLNLNP